MNINLHRISKNRYLDLKYGTGKAFRPRKPILGSDFENFQIDVSYNAMSSRQKIIEKHENRYKISENQYLDLKVGTGMVFRPRKPIFGSDFENFQIDVSYNAMSSRQKIIEKHENRHKISENQYLDLNSGTSKVFKPRKLILVSDFENFQIDVSYDAMYL